MEDVYLELWKARVGHTGKLTKSIMDYIDSYETFVLSDIRHIIEIQQAASNYKKEKVYKLVLTALHSFSEITQLMEIIGKKEDKEKFSKLGLRHVGLFFLQPLVSSLL